MLLQTNDDQIQIRLRINLRLHQATSGLFLILTWALYQFGDGYYAFSSRPYFLFTLFLTLGSLAVKTHVYRHHKKILPKFYWLLNLVDVAVVSFIYYLGFFPVNFLLLLYFFLIFFSLRQLSPRETFYITLLSLLGLGINAVLLWPNFRLLNQALSLNPIYYGLSLLIALTGLILAGLFTHLYAKSDLHLAKHIQKMLDEKEAVLREASLTQANLEEKYAFAYTLTLIQQSLLEEMDEGKLLTQITDIIQGVLGSYSCAIFRIEADGSLKLAAYSGKELPTGLTDLVKAENSLVAQTIKTQTIQNEEAATASEQIYWTQQGINSLLAVPLSTKNNHLGVMLVTGAQNFSFNREQEEQLMIITNQVSLALENTRLHKKTQLMAWHDPLTSLYNRNYLNIFLSVVEGNTDQNLGCLLLDLDLFKEINDTYGHSTGDLVLQEVGAILIKHATGRRIAVRYGGEEFMILGLNSNEDELFALAETIRKETAALTFPTGSGENFSITISCGIALGDGGFKEVFTRADKALYQAKNSGRNRVIIFDPNHNT